jgi:hypothetical protein
VNNEPLLIDKTRAAYLLDLSPREIDRLIVRGTLLTKTIGRKQLLVYASLKSLAVASGTVRTRRAAKPVEVIEVHTGA